jgi:hypothetical protein
MPSLQHPPKNICLKVKMKKIFLAWLIINLFTWEGHRRDELYSSTPETATAGLLLWGQPRLHRQL